MLEKLAIAQNPYMGVLTVTNEEVTLVPGQTGEKEMKVFEKCLRTKTHRTQFGGLSLIGSLTVMNSNGAIFPSFVDLPEDIFPEGFQLKNTIDTRLNAFGNNILANDNFALVHEEYGSDAVREIGDTLGVEVNKATIARIATVGSVAVVSNKGILTHPLASPEEKEFLEDAFKVPCDIGTANFGVAQVGACIVGNTKGAVAGINTTGVELGRIEETLEIY